MKHYREWERDFRASVKRGEIPDKFIPGVRSKDSYPSAEPVLFARWMPQIRRFRPSKGHRPNA
jgi:hypothetical protein